MILEMTNSTNCTEYEQQLTRGSSPCSRCRRGNVHPFSFAENPERDKSVSESARTAAALLLPNKREEGGREEGRERGGGEGGRWGSRPADCGWTYVTGPPTVSPVTPGRSNKVQHENNTTERPHDSPSPPETHTHACTHTHMHASSCTNPRTHTYTHSLTHTHTCTHAHTHTSPRRKHQQSELQQTSPSLSPSFSPPIPLSLSLCITALCLSQPDVCSVHFYLRRHIVFIFCPCSPGGEGMSGI